MLTGDGCTTREAIPIATRVIPGQANTAQITRHALKIALLMVLMKVNGLVLMVSMHKVMISSSAL